MKIDNLLKLLQAYQDAPDDFHATRYWKAYEKEIIECVLKIDPAEMRSGKYPILATFGFNDVVYPDRPKMVLWKKMLLKLLGNIVIKDKAVLPYSLSLRSIQEMAYHHCELLARFIGAKPISDIEMSTFGNPADLFEITGKKYSMQFLSYYVRYCFVNQVNAFRGDEIIVELGSGSGYQIEVLKKLYPGLTVLCFDMPAQIFLCETYLTQALGEEKIVGTERTLDWKDLSAIKKGSVHFLGNWQFPLLRGFEFDLFWNAASFGEMEPDIVRNYLAYIAGNPKWIYLLQARHGKKIEHPITFDDYNHFLPGYNLQSEQDAYQAHRRLSQSGGYFEAVWSRKND